MFGRFAAGFEGVGPQESIDPQSIDTEPTDAFLRNCLRVTMFQSLICKVLPFPDNIHSTRWIDQQTLAFERKGVIIIFDAFGRASMGIVVLDSVTSD